MDAADGWLEHSQTRRETTDAGITRSLVLTSVGGDRVLMVSSLEKFGEGREAQYRDTLSVCVTDRNSGDRLLDFDLSTDVLQPPHTLIYAGDARGVLDFPRLLVGCTVSEEAAADLRSRTRAVRAVRQAPEA